MIVVGERRLLWPGYALGQSSFFKKYERNNFEFFTWSWENDFGNLCQSLIKKIGFPFWKNRPDFQETKVIFCSKFFSIKIGKTEFSFIMNGSENSSKYPRIYFNEFQELLQIILYTKKYVRVQNPVLDLPTNYPQYESNPVFLNN